jgi:hypothetical protein
LQPGGSPKTSQQDSAPEASQPGAQAPQALKAQPAAAPAAPPAARPPIDFPDAVTRAGTRLFVDASEGLGNTPRDLIIDPLIDANTGAQTNSTVDMGAKLAAMIKEQYPRWTVRPLTRETLASGPLLLIGTLTAVKTTQDTEATNDAFRIWLTVVDLRTGRIVAKSLDRATPSAVDAAPTPFFRDSPTWHKDATVNAYINSCQATSKVGDPVQPMYLIRLPAAAILNEAILAYTENRVTEAYQLYRDASLVADAGDLRVLNGLYLTSWRLGKKEEAATAFGKLVGAGIAAERLPLKLLFVPGGTNFVTTAGLPEQYPIWLKAVREQTLAREVCLNVVGHTSHTGSAQYNEALSLRRAVAIKERLVASRPELSSKLTTAGKGWRENLIGLGSDDLRDALDRRVEFQVVSCP